jgi:polyisoprenoid-binding protein YceI
MTNVELFILEVAMRTNTPSTSVAAIPGYVAGTWDIDPTHSEVGFSVRHMMVSKVRGRFEKYSGTIVTGDSIEGASVEADIDLASIWTGSDRRDDHLRSPDFFGTDEHPTMTFRSTGVRAAGDHWIITGDLTLKGITRAVELTTELVGVGPDAYGGTRAGFSATTSINRQDFDVTWNAAIEGGGVVVADEVKINLEIEAVLRS